MVSVCDLVFPLGYKLHVNRDVSFVSAATSVCRRVFGTKSVLKIVGPMKLANE